MELASLSLKFVILQCIRHATFYVNINKNSGRGGNSSAAYVKNILFIITL